MSNYQNAGEGLRKRYISEIGILVTMFFLFLPVVNILAIIGMIVFLVIGSIGLYQMGKDIKDCKIAFVLQMIVLGMELLSNCAELSRELGLFFALAEEVIPMIVTYLVMHSLSGIMRENGEEKLAKLGLTAMWISLISLVFNFLTNFIIGSGIGLLIAIILIIFLIVGLVFELRFYKGCIKKFNTHYIENADDSETGDV